MMQEYLVPEEAAGTRIDKFLADACPALSRSFLQKLLKEGSVTADGKAVKSSFKVNGGETIAFKVPKTGGGGDRGGKYPVGHFV